jgi:two-component system chemotaxis response regulator CheB
MLSAVTRAGAAETLEALAAGAVDFLPKPSGEVSADLSRIQTELLSKVRAAAAATPRAQAMPMPAPRTSTGVGIPRITVPPWASRTLSGIQGRVVMVGISTGGPAALARMLPMLAADVNFGLVIVQHMPADFTGPLAERLNEMSAIEVREAKDGDRPRQGLALIAPGDRHLEFADGGSVRLSDGPEINGCRPSADVMMKSGARVFGRRAVGVIMTGMGRDGAEGISAIKAAGGATLAQDQESSVIFGMPRAAIEAGAIEHVVPLDGLAGMITRAATAAG